ncbi:glucoamylase family protein [Phytomonospora sp. NPDC050363]|uniref:glucoamylase family protein n=1 Tax=Phytomonospora sp. NPDC050363 TaxID=3155642 RepID=UPI0033F5BE43
MRRRSVLAIGGAAAAAAAALTAGPASAAARPEDRPLSSDQRRLLTGYARDTWRSMEAMVHPATGLAADNIGGELAESTRSAYTSPTNIGCLMWSAVVARELGVIDRRTARRRISAVLDTLARLDRHECSGMYYNWYDPATGAVLHTWPDNGNPVYPFLSSVDNAWLATALVVVGNDDPSLRPRAERLLSGMDFGFYYDEAARGPDFGAGLMRGGFWVEQPPDQPAAVKGNYRGCGPDVWYTGHHYGTLNSESRMASYLGIALGQVPPEHYFAMWRTFEPVCDWSWQEMKPEGDYATHLGIRVFEGAYTYRGLKVVPTWGGSMFEALMPELFVPETRWGERSWGRNHQVFVRGQIAHGLDDAKYGHWGFSPSSDPFGGYREYGVDAMGLDSAGYTSDRERTTVDYGFAGCPDREPKPEPASYGDGVVTPHAVFLALGHARSDALAQLAKLRAGFDSYGPGGFYDAVAVRSATVAKRYLALDQGMILGALGNVLAGDVLRDRFAEGRAERRLRPLLGLETFGVPAAQ